MDRFTGKLAVVTGGGTGMGRELARQLSAEGCHVAICDVSATNMAETIALCEVDAPEGTVVSAFVADVADEEQLIAFRRHVEEAHATDHLDLLFNNAGIGGAGSFVADAREEWDQVFAVCWGGVYLGTRTFLPLLLASEAGHVVNTSSVNGFWATLGGNAHTAYSAAKFAVKGFTEALIADFRQNAPHLRASVVMPGHVGTSIVFNSGQYFGRDPKELDDEQVAQLRARFSTQGLTSRWRPTRTCATRWWRSPRASATTRRRRPPRQRRSSSTACAPGSGGSWSVTTPTSSMRPSASTRRTPTSPTSSTASASRACSSARQPIARVLDPAAPVGTVRRPVPCGCRDEAARRRSGVRRAATGHAGGRGRLRRDGVRRRRATGRRTARRAVPRQRRRRRRRRRGGGVGPLPRRVRAERADTVRRRRHHGARRRSPTACRTSATSSRPPTWSVRWSGRAPP